MNKYLLLVMTFVMTAQKSLCVTDVVCLIYITGIIYSKLNILGAKTVKKQLKNCDMHLNHAVILSTTQLGQNKNLHVIEVNNQRLLIGATLNSINLIKELEDVEEIKEIEQLQAPKEEEKVETIEEFDLHKKYL